MERQKDGLPVRLELSARDSAAFVEALLDPMPVNSRLREAICRYRELRGKNVPCRMGDRLYAKAYFTDLYAMEYIWFYLLKRILIFIC
jgi:hypothetical protein